MHSQTWRGLLIVALLFSLSLPLYAMRAMDTGPETGSMCSKTGKSSLVYCQCCLSQEAMDYPRCHALCTASVVAVWQTTWPRVAGHDAPFDSCEVLRLAWPPGPDPFPPKSSTQHKS